MLAADFSMAPEVAGYINLAVDEAQISQDLPDFDTAMTKPSATVLGFESCPAGNTPPAPPTPPPPPPKPPPPPPPGPPPPCHARLDIVIVLDGSASIETADWQTALSFTNKVVDAFAIGSNKTKIGVTQFSEITRDVIELSADKAAIQSAVSATRQMKENTNTVAGFEAAERMLQTHGRSGIDGQLVILVTDGRPNEGGSPVRITQKMKAAGIDIFGIGVGHEVDEREIDSWVSLPVKNHSFMSSDWDSLHKILDTLVANACKHPPSPSSAALALAARIHSAGKYCKFHLPAGLPTARRLELQTVEPRAAVAPRAKTLAVVETPPLELGTTAVDPCNAFATCDACIGQRVQHTTCGWCDGDMSYSGVASKAKCAGKEDGVASKWTCTGHYQTSSCSEPTACGLEGVYRGLRIDNGYKIGEWAATFSPAAGPSKETAAFKFLDPAGSPTTLSGTIECTKKCAEGSSATGVPFTFTTTGSKIMHGICGYADQSQAETSGLMLALSNDGVATPPASWDAAMLATNATVYTYYKCADYKKGTCLFTPP